MFLVVFGFFGLLNTYLGYECSRLEEELGTVKDRYAIPNNNNVRINKVILDVKKIAILESLTKESQNILSEIFAEEESALTMTEETSHNSIKNLISILLEKALWEKNEFYAICSSENILPGALMEKINEYSYDKCDDILVEEIEEGILVNVEYKDLLV